MTQPIHFQTFCYLNISLLILFALLNGLPLTTQAAELVIEPKAPIVKVGESITLSVSGAVYSYPKKLWCKNLRGF